MFREPHTLEPTKPSPKLSQSASQKPLSYLLVSATDHQIIAQAAVRKKKKWLTIFQTVRFPFGFSVSMRPTFTFVFVSTKAVNLTKSVSSEGTPKPVE